MACILQEAENQTHPPTSFPVLYDVGPPLLVQLLNTTSNHLKGIHKDGDK